MVEYPMLDPFPRPPGTSPQSCESVTVKRVGRAGGSLSLKRGVGRTVARTEMGLCESFGGDDGFAA